MSADLSAESRALRAKALLEDETFIEALAVVEVDAVNALASADVADPAALIRPTAALQAVRAVRRHVESIVTNGLSDAPPAPVFA